MEILDNTIIAYTPEVKLEEMMAISSSMLQLGIEQTDVMNSNF
jgi:hypothetical protein